MKNLQNPEIMNLNNTFWKGMIHYETELEKKDRILGENKVDFVPPKKRNNGCKIYEKRIVK